MDSSSALTAPVSLLRYQIGNHLGSASLELDEAAQVISYEEYHPYGTTSYRATDSATEVSPKRYRYTGKEKDEETGLYYHGARYCVPWLGKWASCDPLLWQRPAISPYLAFAASPIRFVDPDGKKPLVESDFKTLDDLKKEIPIVYTPRALKGTYLPQSGEFEYDYEPAYVTVSDPKAGSQYRNTLSEDTPSEAELQRIAGVEIGEQVMWGASHRDVLLYRADLEAVVKLSYAPKNSAGTALFYVAEEMSKNVQGDNPSRYINAFKHVFGQSVITTLRGRGVADLVGDIHEREFVSDVFATPREATAKPDKRFCDSK